jgi:hypothetical protein
MLDVPQSFQKCDMGQLNFTKAEIMEQLRQNFVYVFGKLVQ